MNNKNEITFAFRESANSFLSLRASSLFRVAGERASEWQSHELKGRKLELAMITKGFSFILRLGEVKVPV